MLTEVYEFLGRHGTVGQRASFFAVSAEGAEAVLEFSLTSFPRQLVRVLVAGDVEELTIRLKLPDDAAAQNIQIERLTSESLAESWGALDGNWDNDQFYDLNDRRTGFFRIASYASVMRSRVAPSRWASVVAVVDPVMDRLAALVEAFEASGVQMPFDQTPVHLRGLNHPLVLQKPRATSHAVANLPTRSQLEVALPQLAFLATRSTLGGLFARLAHDWAIFVHLWRTPELVRRDDDQYLPEEMVSPPDAFVEGLTHAALAFRDQLDAVAPIVAKGRQKATLERLIEFTELPFWKHRWFLYELWTLVRVLRVGATAGDVKLEGLTEARPGVIEWVLPGGSARSPVARVIKQKRSVSIWTQLKSQHPNTGAGLEPDLRIRADRALESDLFLIENKDRLALASGTFAEIVKRYVTGTEARGA